MIDEVDLFLPDQTLETKALWWLIPPDLLERARVSRAAVPGSLHAAEHAAIGMLPLVATCDRWDVGGVSTALHPDTGMATIFIYDGYPGGAGIAERGFRSRRARCWRRRSRRFASARAPGLPLLRAVAEVRQRQRAAGQAGGRRAPGGHARAGRGASRMTGAPNPRTWPSAGPDPAPADVAAHCESVGRALARAGAVLVCGGLGGVMEAAARGAAAEGGTCSASSPAGPPGAPNDFVTVSVPTGMGEMRNALVVRAADAVIAVGGEFGTLSEIALRPEGRGRRSSGSARGSSRSRGSGATTTSCGSRRRTRQWPRRCAPSGSQAA